ncbi:hypothetical protein [Vibrio mexicanus]|uniref:hypothetical protein n=1 Tax=Vibrio mexicanus TaxID=1004326 RepID=UPI000AC57ADA|nr:hypothetical protein [Vibrio mexicanus]
MRQLSFRLCRALDGYVYAFLTDQMGKEDLFDNGYKVAYKSRDDNRRKELLARWQSVYTVKSIDCLQVSEPDGLPQVVQVAFEQMVEKLIAGVDVLFCDYNLAIEADLPICDGIMNKYRSTDFVLFSRDELIGPDAVTQPYMVSYCVPRYPESGNQSSQHRIYCKTDGFAFSRAIDAIVNQRERDALNGGISEPKRMATSAKHQCERTLRNKPLTFLLNQQCSSIVQQPR